MLSQVFARTLPNSVPTSWVERDQDNFFDERQFGLIPSHPQIYRHTLQRKVKQSEEIQDSTDKEDVITHKEKMINTQSSLCWMEKVIIVEDKICCNKSISKEYAVMLNSLSFINSTKNLNSNHFLFGQDNSNLSRKHDPNNMKNFTTVRETFEKIITEKKKVICGFGPVATKQYFKFPNSRREIVEIKVGSEYSNQLKETPYDNQLSLLPFKPTTQASTTYNTVQTSSNPIKNSVTEIPVVEILLEEKAPDEDLKIYPRKASQEDSEKLTQDTYLLEHNISYQNSNNSQIIKNPFDDTHLVQRLKSMKKPILFNVLFPDENVFKHMPGRDEERKYKVTVKLSVTLEEISNNNNSVTLKLFESSLIVLKLNSK